MFQEKKVNYNADNKKKPVLSKIMTSHTCAWTIPDFSVNGVYQVGEYLDSPKFRIPDWNDAGREYTWYLRLYANGYNSETQDYLNVYVCLEDKVENYTDFCMRLDCKLSILAQDNRETNVQYSVPNILKVRKDYIYIFKRFISRNHLLCLPDIFLNDSNLTLLCSIRLKQSNEKIVSEEPHHVVCRQIAEDISSLYENSETYDFKLIANDKREFSVHNHIIAARSPVFYETMLHDRKNAKVAFIKDMDPEVLSILIKFIYKGTIHTSQDIIEKLLIVGHKYEIYSLKSLCEMYLGASLTIDNAIKMLFLAEKYDACDLKDITIEFIIAHPAQVMKTHDFTELGTCNFSLLKDVFCALAINVQNTSND